ncbi:MULTISPECIES: SoxR reducing system RseC family protein [Fusobacterium]|uniref:SoxR reducing system RseC family protein n=1 Tax=Fusobacterium TaxID=848 RepID=UPI001F5007B5|nr:MULTISPECIES: SoxR reducing system RseC family protein [Fusobacterium]MCI5724441.1 SoxR reducing system RseC family protein [Fusobacterium sp.]MCI7224377.1 SoxR reducing system RseC family protein [Fusobacterium sp.]MDY5305938.1 SoxR reducing system RseC family protein [Fusobacterium gastrosuis]
MENKGIVTKINGNKVSIKLYKSSSCSHCSQCSEASKYGKDFEFKIDRAVNLGDLVTLEISEKDVIKAATIAYVMPPIFMILGYIIMAKFGFSEGKSILGSFGGLVIAFLFLFIYDKFFAKKNIDEEIKIVSVEKYDPNVVCNDETCEDFF